MENIQQIMDAAVAAATATAKTDNGFLIVPSTYKVVDLDDFNDGPSRFREKFVTDHFESFASYWHDHASDESRIYVNKSTMSAKVCFDPGAPGAPSHRSHWAALGLTKTPMLNAMQEVSGKRLTQRQAAEFLEDWRVDLRALDADGNVIDLRKVVAAIRKFDVKGKAESGHVETSLATSKSAFASLEAGNKELIPEYIVANGEPYLGLPKQDILMRLFVHMKVDEAPTFSLSIVRPDSLQEVFAELFVDTLNDVLRSRFSGDPADDIDWKILIGSI